MPKLSFTETRKKFFFSFLFSFLWLLRVYSTIIPEEGILREYAEPNLGAGYVESCASCSEQFESLDAKGMLANVMDTANSAPEGKKDENVHQGIHVHWKDLKRLPESYYLLSVYLASASLTSAFMVSNRSPFSLAYKHANAWF